VLQAGTGRRLINPELGMPGPGIRIYCDPIVHIESDLMVTALVLETTNCKIVLIGCDLAVISSALAHEVRQAVARTVGTELSHVLVNYSHTHASPSIKGWGMVNDGDQAAAIERYQGRLVEAAEQAAGEADRSRQPARLAAGWGEAPLGVYRREKGPNDRFILGEVPQTPIDPSVGVIRVDDLDGRPISVVFSYGCHPVIMGPRAQAASSDYPGAARRLIEDVIGGTALFLQACGGNVNPRYGIGFEVDCRDVKDREGTVLAGAVIATASNLRTHKRRGSRTLLGDLGIALWPWVAVDGMIAPPAAAVERTLAIPLSDLPPLNVAQGLRDRYAAELASAQARRARTSDLTVAARWAQWAAILVEACALSEGTLHAPTGTFFIRNGKATFETTIQGIRVGDVAILATSFEMFFETGLMIKERSPFPHTEVIGYSNGCAGYLPRAEDYPAGGWSVEERYAVPDLFPQSWLWPVIVHPGAEEQVVEGAIAVLNELV
jgi:neutral ceramidase